jgi:hypothetical protein
MRRRPTSQRHAVRDWLPRPVPTYSMQRVASCGAAVLRAFAPPGGWLASVMPAVAAAAWVDARVQHRLPALALWQQVHGRVPVWRRIKGDAARRRGVGAAAQLARHCAP